MSADAGKVEVLDVEFGADRTRYLLQFLQARDTSRVRRPFWAEGDRNATWFTELSVCDPNERPNQQEHTVQPLRALR